jgi:hypothetical protein
MATDLDRKQVVSFEELLMSQVVQQEALTMSRVENGKRNEWTNGRKARIW